MGLPKGCNRMTVSEFHFRKALVVTGLAVSLFVFTNGPRKQSSNCVGPILLMGGCD